MSVLSIGALSTQLACASDESDQTEIKLRAPLEDANCTDMVITVLGRTIDIRNASIDASMDADGSALETRGPSVRLSCRAKR